MHALALHDAGSLQLERAAPDRGDVAESVDRVAERVDHAAEVAVADGHRQHLAGARDLLAGFDAGEVAEHDDTDLVLVEVQGKTLRAVLEHDQFVGHDAGQALDVGDAVRGVHDGADLRRRGPGGLVGGDEVLQRVTDDVGADREFCHCLPFVLTTSVWGRGPKPPPCGGKSVSRPVAAGVRPGAWTRWRR